MDRIPNTEASAEDYLRLRQWFVVSGFRLEAILSRLGIKQLSQLEPLRDRYKDFGPVETACQLLISIFVEGKPLGGSVLEAVAGMEHRQLLERLHLIFPNGDGDLAATVALYPIEHIYIASDRYNSPDGSQFEGFDDIVYPCLFETTARFLRVLPRTECGAVLDLCSGTGVAALLLAKTSGHTVAADITERSKLYALFNQKMNGIENSSVVAGDLYQPATGQTFDRIVVHPPYQPVYRHQQIFNSGGVDGEQITRRCVEEAYPHLRPGGRLYCLAQITARHEPVDERVRQWIVAANGSDASADCDIGFFITKRHEIEPFAAKATLTTKGNELDFRSWLREFARLGVRSLDYGLLIVERHAAPRDPFTICLKAPETWDPADFETTFAWEADRREPDFEARLWSRRFRTTPSCKLEVEHTLSDQGWQVGHYKLSQSGPYDVKIQASQGVAHLLGMMDGTRTVDQCFRELERVSAGVSRLQLAATVISMVSEGFLIAA